jgi:signal transduction histidine kinase
VLRSGTFQFKLMTAFALLLALIAATSALSWWALERKAYYSERVRLAHDVLDHHLLLAERGQRLLRFQADAPATAEEGEEERLRAQISAEITNARAAITKEVALIGQTGSTDELDELKELERLDAIQSSLWRAADGEDDSRWRALIDEAAADERSELAVTDTASQRIFEILKLVFAADIALVTLIGCFLFVRLRNAFQRPIERLLAGTRALTAGDLSHRIELEGRDEFAVLSNSFDAMAADLEAQANTITKSRDALEQTVTERTESLRSANAQLAEEADRRRRFLADVSHELRTPLTIIRGEAEVTMRGADKPLADYQGALARIAEQTTGMARLVDDLLFVARNDEGQPRLVLRRIAIAPLLAKCVEAMRSLVESDGGRIDFDSDCDDATVIADPDRVRQLVHILIDNAMRYSVDVPSIDLALAEAPGGFAIRVSDQGIGIPPVELPFVFDRFRRGAIANSRNDDGVGIGLPMAKSIVEAHQGSISIESTEGHGTVVSVFLPSGDARLRAVA